MSLRALVAFLLVVGLVSCGAAYAVDPESPEGAAVVFEALSGNPEKVRESLTFADENWRDGFAPMVLELSYFTRDPAVRVRLLRLFEKKTGRRHQDLDEYWKFIWSRPPADHPGYALFKSSLYRLIDPKFAGYFATERTALIRLDEVRWGGVFQDGISPLRDPKMIAADEADYLRDSNVVFGIEVNGDARAYPKRILAWHEMFVDEVGGVPVAGVYCTLCGTVILYETAVHGVQHRMGTSGFLYRSNKLMYDRATQSLWSTLKGTPVIGPLADADPKIVLPRRAVVTTTWGEWKRRHPETQVLSLETGHKRDYGEGVAYRDYFATDELMFPVPEDDRRLKNKAEVFTLKGEGDETVAISARFLKKNPIHHDEISGTRFVVLTDKSGANRAYQTTLQFTQWDGDRTAVDENGLRWHLTEAELRSDQGETLPRMPAQRAFWFGWQAAFPNARLVK